MHSETIAFAFQNTKLLGYLTEPPGGVSSGFKLLLGGNQHGEKRTVGTFYSCSTRKPRQTTAITLVEVLVVISCIGLLIGLLLPSVQSARQTARRISCSNNARQVVLSLNLFHDSHRQLPQGTCSWRSSTPFRGWYSQLLNYIEQDAMLQQVESAYAVSRNPFDVVNHRLMQQRVNTFLCPEDGRLFQTVIAGRSGLLVALTSFQGNAGTDSNRKDGALFAGSDVRFAKVTDGLSNTYAFGERPPSPQFDFGWWYAGVGDVPLVVETGDGLAG